MAWADTQQYIDYLPADGPFIDGEVARVPRSDVVPDGSGVLCRTGVLSPDAVFFLKR